MEEDATHLYKQTRRANAKRHAAISTNAGSLANNPVKDYIVAMSLEQPRAILKDYYMWKHVLCVFVTRTSILNPDTFTISEDLALTKEL